MNPKLLAALAITTGALAMPAASLQAQDPTAVASPAYVVADFQLADPVGIKPYGEQVEATFQPFGGRFLIRGGKASPLEGELLQGRLIVIAFDNAERARAWYDSPAYRKLREIRHRSGTTRMAIVEGVAASSAKKP